MREERTEGRQLDLFDGTGEAVAMPGVTGAGARTSATGLDGRAAACHAVERQRVGGVVAHRDNTFDPAFDRERTDRQRDRIESFMADGAWHLLAELSAATGAPEASASARLRDMRRDGAIIERRRRGDPARGLHEYRLAARRAP